MEIDETIKERIQELIIDLLIDTDLLKKDIIKLISNEVYFLERGIKWL